MCAAKRKALVIGGGIGGLTAALALRRGGWEVEVFEQAPELREVGSGLVGHRQRAEGPARAGR